MNLMAARHLNADVHQGSFGLGLGNHIHLYRRPQLVADWEYNI
jgi:hypothetical protein